MNRTYVIAEAGSCHDGFFDRAVSLVRAAGDAKADAVKFQFWSDPDELADRRRVPPAYREIYRQYRMPSAWLWDLSRIAAEQSLDFMCTAYLPQDVAVIAPFVRHFKVASFENGSESLLRAHVPFVHLTSGKRLHVSLGLGADIHEVCEMFGGSYPQVAPQLSFLHCISAYPAPVGTLALDRIREYALDGFSDHSDPALTWTGGLSVAAGATVIEAHLKHPSTDVTNPDAPHAMTPLQFGDYVRHVRFAETCMYGYADSAASVAVEAAMARYKVQS